MKNFLFISLLFLMPLTVMSQKVTVQIIKSGNAAVSEWQILDKQYHPAIPGSEYLKEDSVSFNLEPNEHYIFEVSVSDIFYSDTSLYSLRINGEPIMFISTKVGSGDHFYPFFTGVKAEQTKIMGGTNANIADFPWQVYYESGNYLCGGSIINENWVVTAAHCTKDSNGNPIPASSMDIRVGASSNPTNNGEKYYVSSVIAHPGFNSQTLVDDIALLKIAGPINFTNATPIKLVSPYDAATGVTDPGVMSWVTGWGLINVNPKTLPSNLQKVQLPIVSNAQAATVWSSIPTTDIMAGYLAGNKDACNGDSGGPLIVPVNSEYKLAGIVSWGSTTCDTYGGYTRVSALEDWILTNTGIKYTPPSPVGDTLICQGVDSSHYSVGSLSGATAYEWQILPASAGVINGNSNNATVIWNTTYTGLVTIWLRATINGTLSEWSKLNINIVLNTKILSQTIDTVLCAGQSVFLSINAEGYNLTYQWYRNGALIPLYSYNVFYVPFSITGNSGIYKCNVSGSCGTMFSNDINLTIHPLTDITYISPDTEVAFGKDATLEVKSDGYNLTYQWQKDGQLLDNSTSSQLMLQNVNANNTGLYQSIVSGFCGTKTSDTVYVYVKRTDYKNEPEISLWPTITNDVFNVALSNDEYYNIRIFSPLGIMIRELTNCRYQTVVNTTNIPGGIYIVNIYNSSFRRSFKLIKK